MKITANRKEESLLEALCPAQKITFGNKGVPRYMDAPMFDILQWADAPKNTDHSSDFKSKSYLLKDKINKSGNNWKTENADNYRKHIYSPNKGKLYFGIL